MNSVDRKGSGGLFRRQFHTAAKRTTMFGEVQLLEPDSAKCQLKAMLDTNDTLARNLIFLEQIFSELAK